MNIFMTLQLNFVFRLNPIMVPSPAGNLPLVIIKEFPSDWSSYLWSCPAATSLLNNSFH